jgi:uncharacterized protein YlaN (UPF0358 family)
VYTVEADEEEKKSMKKRIKELEKEVSELKRSRKWYESSRKGIATTGKRKVREMEVQLQKLTTQTAVLQEVLDSTMIYIAAELEKEKEEEAREEAAAAYAAAAPPPPLPPAAPAAPPPPAPLSRVRKIGTVSGLPGSRNPRRDEELWAKSLQATLQDSFKPHTALAQHAALLKCLRDLEAENPSLFSSRGETASGYRFPGIVSAKLYSVWLPLVPRPLQRFKK